MLVLGTVKAILPLELLIALPNNLQGHVKITEISDILTEKLKNDESAMVSWSTFPRDSIVLDNLGTQK